MQVRSVMQKEFYKQTFYHKKDSIKMISEAVNTYIKIYEYFLQTGEYRQ